jgi:hypothetical protein
MKDTWRITKSLTNTSHQVPPIKHNGNIAITNQEKVNMFADTLEEVFTANPDVDTKFTVSTEQVVTTFLKHVAAPAAVRNQAEAPFGSCIRAGQWEPVQFIAWEMALIITFRTCYASNKLIISLIYFIFLY